MSVQLKKGQRLLGVKIKRIGINGEGVANYKGKILFVNGAITGEVCDVRVADVQKTFATGNVIKLKKKSKNRVKPFCEVYGKCGGCQLQHLDYTAQLELKKDLLRQALEKFKPQGYKNYPLLDTIGMENPKNYRNKAQFQLASFHGKVVSGLYELNSHKIVDLSNCPIQDERTQKVMNTAVRLLEKYKLPIYNERSRTGNFRTLMTRVALATGEVQLVFITAKAEFPKKEVIIKELQALHPEITSIMQNINAKRTSEIFGNKTLNLWGKSAINERLGDVAFELSARAFFQLNPVQTKKLYELAISALDLTSEDILVDAYCGVGTIGLSAAKFVKEVRGMDTIPQAIADAQKNAETLGISHATYEVGTAEHLLPKWINEGFQLTSVIVDPPRSGLDERLIQTLLEITPEKFVYISCNVSTLARDMVKLSQKYEVESMQSVDMFPHTARCEVVVKMKLKSN
ncbi:23S rRNA (uracil-5-)-methyltransferase RumA [Pilibacter termitis]|uniref:23S rRNA (Uracil-5-)-methyltransferase RumA n=1 Tax=Pilibacter termitis TaxID=263852 RepID=A0A1T4M0R7_9ENTE|nr:23S rRNA (uracil(1939)-C(5))-methyltransferase RlmD [Pilibacter termitis]SJZ60579.1 23S rRNA (uracil-5-)-methyltransferase RumA [Pilibacter termitis]